MILAVDNFAPSVVVPFIYEEAILSSIRERIPSGAFLFSPDPIPNSHHSKLSQHKLLLLLLQDLKLHVARETSQVVKLDPGRKSGSLVIAKLKTLSFLPIRTGEKKVCLFGGQAPISH